MRTSVQCTNFSERRYKTIARKKSSRKFQLTINNPVEAGYTHDTIELIMREFSTAYWCMCDEIGEQGTYHTHIFFIAKNGVMFDTVKNRFPTAHIEDVKGSNENNYNYICKNGDKYADKKETNLPNTFKEFGTLPPDSKAGTTLSTEILEMIQNGSSDNDIITTYPSAIYKIDSINKARQIINEEKYKNEFRHLSVTYLWGKSGSGKTRYVMEKYGYANVYRITDYEHPFDNYQGQKVVLFEEFRSSLKISDMLNYLDGYPLQLPCRYANKVAIYDTVYLATNIPIDKQYPEIQHTEKETYNAFMRRIHKVEEITKTAQSTEIESAEDFEIIE